MPSSGFSFEQRDLEVLQILERTPEINQRNLAQETSMALGLVNSCLKRLVRKGWIKIHEAPRRRYLYYLTPKGLTEKTRLTYEYVRYSVQYYALARHQCRTLFLKLTQEGVRRVAFLGRSDLAEIAYFSLHEFDIEFLALYEEPIPSPGTFFGRPIQPLSAIKVGLTGQYDVLIYTRLAPPAITGELAGINLREIF